MFPYCESFLLSTEVSIERFGDVFILEKEILSAAILLYSTVTAS
jgi:hypothetical protein